MAPALVELLVTFTGVFSFAAPSHNLLVSSPPLSLTSIHYSDHGFSSDPFGEASRLRLSSPPAEQLLRHLAPRSVRDVGEVPRMFAAAGSHTCSLVPVTAAAQSPPWSLITRSLKKKETGNVKPACLAITAMLNTSLQQTPLQLEAADLFWEAAACERVHVCVYACKCKSVTC
ncbi:hypothetical protein ILYODFUR_007934 [Ilyodon furcidens]|uniref:Secreted protein n=1 Tax=Ilyodon furcidens TaxID=33524 RepID=A0ABV0T9X9_9TELE